MAAPGVGFADGLDRVTRMASYHFACPYCSGAFEVSAPELGQAIACPHCAATVTLPTELPPPPPDLPPAVEEPEGGVYAFLADPTPSPAARSAPSRPSQVTRSSAKRPAISARERDRRRALRNVVLMVVGLLVLVLAVVVLSRL